MECERCGGLVLEELDTDGVYQFTIHRCVNCGSRNQPRYFSPETVIDRQEFSSRQALIDEMQRSAVDGLSHSDS